MINLQHLIDGMSADWQRERAESQMTLGQLIKDLEQMHADTPLAMSSTATSYRGYYCDLSFKPGSSTAGELLDACRAAMGAVFHGYKGGEFVMGARTPLWIAHYGCCGQRLMSVAGGNVVTAAEDDTV